MIEVVAAGLFSTIQDRGRSGFYALGIPPSGAMDRFAHDAANALVGNRPEAAGIETTFLGPTLTFGEFTVVAVTGADVAVTLDGVRVPLWMSQIVRAGQTLQFGMTRSGARAYLAVRGGVDVPPVMGSRSTYVTSGLGGMQGRALRSGDVLTVGHLLTPGTEPRGGVAVPDDLVPTYSTEHEIRVVPGLCDYRLTPESVRHLYSEPYGVTIESNRTGYRLSGRPLEFVEREVPFGAGADPSNVVNLGYPVGSIQVPSGAELICLLRDAVTGGGYATVGTVISADLDLLAQAKSPDRVRFIPVSVDVALAERATRAQRLQRIARVVTR
jgi:biotin-dependent carboxylase-like uncharacterized protein